MRINCPICMMDETLDIGTIAEVAEIVNKHNLKAISYIKILNMIKGRCLNGDEHSFEFDDDFLKSVTDLVDKHKKSNADAQKLIEENDGIEKELSEHEAKIKELKAKLEANKDRVVGLDRDATNYKVSIGAMTGADDITIWY